jgi:glycosyltransferase involved in cell wall biosynthesis
MGRRAVREADVVVVPTRAVATQLGSLVPGFDGCRVEVVANGLSPRWGGLLSGPGVDDGVRARSLALPEDGYWLFVGTLEPRKGIDVLLRALARSPAEVPLLVVGPAGWGGVDIEEQSRLVGLRPGMVRIMGRVSDEDLAVLYRGATALVVPSGAEGYGYPVLEGMAAGTAVVTSDDAALKETGGGVPLTFPVGDDQELAAVLGRLATDSSLRAALGRRGRASAAGRTTIEAALRLWDIYRSLV